VKKPIKFVLSDEEDLTFPIVGICSSFNDYRMGWFLNNVMGWKLVQSQDMLEVPIKKQKQWVPFSYYAFEHQAYHYQAYLIKNKQNGALLASEFPELDFLLVLHNNHEINLDTLIHELRNQNGIIAAYLSSSEAFGSSEYLQFN
jgi:hypothetical protein